MDKIFCLLFWSDNRTDNRVEFISQILIKLQLRNLNKAFTWKSQPNISLSTKLKLNILTKPSFIILTKIQLRNLNQTSAAKYWPNFSFKISPELQLQTPDQTLCWKSKQKLSLMTKPQLKNLQQTVNMILILIWYLSFFYFWAQLFSTWKRVNCGKINFATKQRK